MTAADGVGSAMTIGTLSTKHVLHVVVIAAIVIVVTTVIIVVATVGRRAHINRHVGVNTRQTIMTFVHHFTLITIVATNADPTGAAYIVRHRNVVIIIAIGLKREAAVGRIRSKLTANQGLFGVEWTL